CLSIHPPCGFRVRPTLRAGSAPTLPGPGTRPGTARAAPGAPESRSALDRVERPERAGKNGLERLEPVSLRHVETGLFGGLPFGERKQRFDRLVDRLQAERALVAVVVRRVDRLGHLLDPRDGLDGTAVGRGDAGRDDTSQRAVVGLDAHDARGGDAQVGGAEVAYADQVRG